MESVAEAEHAPKLPSVSVRPSEVEEGSSVTLTCSSDANPAAQYTWYKDGYKRPSEDSQLFFSSIQSSDSGQYDCSAENKLGWKWSASSFINVKYAPKLPSVSVRPSEVEEGSSVTLTCSSDANPAAQYTWYKEEEESPKASGQNFTITDVRPEHSGNYSCEAQNTRGSQRSTVALTVVPAVRSSVKMLNLIRATLVVLLLVPLLVVSLWLRKKERISFQTGPKEAVEMMQVRGSADQTSLQHVSNERQWNCWTLILIVTRSQADDLL
ncbi:B-cell receptor CD22-like [Leuresthes tenuis]|uniref:B-cell receptor CD22-like n=1 Tax=Leuresthes tenuis TaxID=355514 RepID=UPI003B514ED1